MCGGFVGDILDTVGDIVEDVGDFVGDTVDAIVEDPLGAIVSVGAMAMGVPPVFAGALGGAASAAEHGGNILEGALVGGAAGYVGGVAGGAAAEAGAGAALSGAAGGAAGGATGAALTGGDIGQGALTGGFLGGATGAGYEYFNPQTGNSTYTFDDGSTITRNPAGDVVGSTPSPYQPAPVTDAGSSIGTGMLPVNDAIDYTNWQNSGGTGDYNPVRPPVDLASTGISDSAAGTVYQGPNGPEVVLDSGKTVLIADLERAIASGQTISVDGNMVTDFKAELSGIPRSVENPGAGNLPEGTELASIENSNGAKWDDALDTYVNPNTGAYFSQEANAWVQPAGTGQSVSGQGNIGIPDSYVAPVTVNPDGSSTTVNWNGSVTTTFSDGTSITSNPDGSSVSKDASGTSHVTGSGSGSGGGIDMGNGSTTYTYDDGSSITIHPDGTATSTPAPSDIPEITITDTRPTSTTPVTEIPEMVITDTRPTTPVTPVTPVTPDVTTTPTTVTPDGWTPTPVTPVFPVVTPKPPVTPPVTPPYTDVTPGGTLPTLHIPKGLNPGWIEPTPFYQTTSPVQSQYYWGSHGYQEGPTFNAQQYNTVPGAPQQGWGLQQMGGVARPQDIVDYINSPEYQAQFVSGPVAPARG